MRPTRPVDERLPWIHALSDLADARGATTPRARIEALRAGGRALGDALRAGPRAVAVVTLDNTTLPYPTRFAFNGAVPLPWPMVILTHRTLLVQVQTEGGIKNVLFNPTDRERSRQTPFFLKLAKKLELVGSWAEKLVARQGPPIEEQLRALGVGPEAIDVIAFDHFHTQDLRGQLGPEGRYPNALLLAPAREWRDWDGLHPMQRAWFVEDGKRGVPDDRVVVFDDDLALGQGCLLLRTPGHTTGNQTLFVHGEGGVFGCSENGCSADNWSPRHAGVPGLRKFADHYEVEVVLNANTPESGGDQYASMVLERSLVDPVADVPGFVQMFPSSEVTPTPLAPGLRPAVVFGNRNSGQVVTTR